MPRRNSKLPWKKGFRKLPAAIEGTLSRLPADTDCVVGCAKIISAEEIKAGTYLHLGIESTQDLRADFESFIPSPNVGPASYANATPIERPDKRRGKHSKLIHGRAPTRGRFTSHPTTYRRDVWHRTFNPPAMAHIAFKLLAGEPADKGARVHFQIQEVINTSDPECRAKLLRCINLMQENVGLIDLLPAAKAEAESIRRVSEDIGWRVLPDNERSDVIGRLTRRVARDQPKRALAIHDRFDFILTLKPRKILHSTRGFIGYFVIEFCDNLAVFENLEVDHAMYVVRSAQEEHSRLTRSQLKARMGEDVERIVHTKGWQQRLATIVKKSRGDQGPVAGDLV